MRLMPWICAASGTFAEVYAATCVMPREGGVPSAGLALAWHAAAALLATEGLCALLPARLRGGARAPAVTFVLAFGLPVVGLVGLSLLWSTLARRHVPPPAPRVVEIPLPPLPVMPPEAPASQPPVAGVIQRARDATRRLDAVLATRRLRDRQALPLLRRALRDADDEVRLLAYALIQQREQTLDHELRAATARLETAPATEAPRWHRRIAALEHELVWTGLAQGDARRHLLESASRHADKARGKAPDPSLELLRGRIALALGAFDEAREALDASAAAGLPERVVAPYLAELAFASRFHSPAQPSAAGRSTA